VNGWIADSNSIEDLPGMFSAALFDRLKHCLPEEVVSRLDIDGDNATFVFSFELPFQLFAVNCFRFPVEGRCVTRSSCGLRLLWARIQEMRTGRKLVAKGDRSSDRNRIGRESGEFSAQVGESMYWRH
jgi:hypothetical protein